MTAGQRFGAHEFHSIGQLGSQYRHSGQQEFMSAVRTGLAIPAVRGFGDQTLATYMTERESPLSHAGWPGPTRNS